MATPTTIILVLIVMMLLALAIANKLEMDEVHEELWDIMDRIETLSLIERTAPKRRQGTIGSVEIEIELNQKKKEEFHRDLDAISERLEEICERWATISEAVAEHSGGEDHEQNDH